MLKKLLPGGSAKDRKREKRQERKRQEKSRDVCHEEPEELDGFVVVNSGKKENTENISLQSGGPPLYDSLVCICVGVYKLINRHYKSWSTGERRRVFKIKNLRVVHHPCMKYCYVYVNWCPHTDNALSWSTGKRRRTLNELSEWCSNFVCLIRTFYIQEIYPF